MRAIRPALALVALLAVIGGLVYTQSTLTARATAEATATADGAFAFRWPKGIVWTYRLDLTGQKTIDAGGTRLDGRLDLAGHITLQSHGKRGETTHLALRFADLERHALTVMGREVIPDAAALVGPTALVELTDEGTLAALRFAPDAPPVFRHLAQLVIGEMQLVVAPGELTWEAREPTQHGEAITDYEVIAADPHAIELGRYRFDYARLDGAPADTPVSVDANYRARIARAGHVLSLAGTETVAAGDAVRISGAIDLALVAMGPAADPAAPVATYTDRRAPDAWPISAEAHRAMLARRAGDLTIDRIVTDLRRFGPGGEMPEHSRWAWQAAGRLLLDPGAAAHLGRLVTDDPAIGHRGRALALDLLAQVGRPEAQAALRNALEALPRDAKRAALLTRLGFVERPEPATVELAAAEWQRAEGVERQSAATVLGAAAGHLYRSGETEQALAHVRRLEAGLSRGEDRRATILALGNAGVPEAVMTIAAHAADPDPAVRRAVATALRKTPGLVAHEALGALMTDADPQVSRAAVRALGRHPLAADDLTGLAARVRAGELGPSTHGALVDLLVRHGDLDPDARRALGLALAQRATDGRVRARLARL